MEQSGKEVRLLLKSQNEQNKYETIHFLKMSLYILCHFFTTHFRGNSNNLLFFKDSGITSGASVPKFGNRI